MDPREERSARILREKLYDLASTRDIASITAAELSRETGLARRTIYNHGENPQEILFRYLAESLTAIREQIVRDAETLTARESFELGLTRLFDHVQNHRSIYTNALSRTTSPAWHYLLTQHFSVSISLFEKVFPPQLATISPDIGDMIAFSLAHGIVGAIEAWLRLDGEPDVELCRRVIFAIVPGWFIDE